MPDDEVDLEAELAKLTPEQLRKFEFVINEDGSVTFVDFPEELMELAGSGALHPVEPTTYPLDDVVVALTDLAERRVAGKVVLVP